VLLRLEAVPEALRCEFTRSIAGETQRLGNRRAKEGVA
jgi:hypothetical protein